MRYNTTMLEKYIALKERLEAKKETKRQALADIEEEFGDVEAQFEAERAKIMEWMLGENVTTHIEADGIVEVRKSKQKFVVPDEEVLVTFLVDNKMKEALTIKKAQVNVLRQLEQIPDNVVHIVTEDELVIRTK